MKTYAIYDTKDYEQCVFLGSINEIAKYLGYSRESLYSHISRDKNNKKLLNHRYELVDVTDCEDDIEEHHTIKTDEEIFKEILKAFTIKVEFPIFDEFKWQIKGIKDKIIVDEEWKNIKGFHYSISNYGRFRNDKSGKLKNPRYHRWILQVDIYENGKRYTCDVARMVAHYFIRKVNKNERVRYIDGDRRNNYYKNLEIVSK